MWTIAGRVRVDRLQQQHRDRRDLDEGQKVACRLVVARRNTAKLFDAVDESFHQVPLLVQVAIQFALLFQVASRRNHRRGAAALNVIDQLLAVVTFVTHRGVKVVSRQKGFGLSDVGNLARRQLELHRHAQAVDHHMEFRGKTATGTAQRLLIQARLVAPSFAPAACWRARMTLESKINLSRSGSRNSRKIRSQIPLRAHRSNRLHTEFQLPNRSGRSRHGAPVFAIQRTASTKRRLSFAVTPGSPCWPGKKSLMRFQCSSEIAWRGSMADPPWFAKMGP